MYKTAIKAVVAIMAMFLSLNSFAEIYPWLEIKKDDIYSVENLKVETFIKLQLIKNAKKSIKLITYDQRCGDEFSAPILSEFKRAAERGVKVTIGASWYLGFLFDRCGKFSSQNYLGNNPWVSNIEYFTFGGPENEGFSLLDGTHHKIFLVDDEIALIGGRGFSTIYQRWIDTGFFIKNQFVNQIVKLADNVYNDIAKTPSWNMFDYENHDKTPERFELTAKLSTVEAREVNEILDWLYAKNTQASKIKVRTIHYDFINQMLKIPAEERSRITSVEDRLAYLKDDVVDVVVERINSAKEIHMNVLSAVLHPKLKIALINAAKRGANVELLTNIAMPKILSNNYTANDTYPHVTSPLWAMALDDLKDLLIGGVRVNRFQYEETDQWIYLHRKLAIIDNHVFIGSHNFNLPSTFANDESTFEIESDELAKEYFAKYYEPVRFYNTWPIHLEEVLKDINKAKFIKFFLEPFMAIM